MQPEIWVYNESTQATNKEVQDACAAIQRQLTQDFEPIWKMTSIMHFAQNGEAFKPDVRVFKLVDEYPADQQEAEALGFHTVIDGVPIAYIDISLCKKDGIAWPTCLSHEVLEETADPECARCFDIGGGHVMATEVCDAVEGGTGYKIDGVPLENFVTPNYYIRGSKGPWDFCKVLPGPLTRTDEGYDETATIGEWKQHSGLKTRSAKRVVGKQSRRARRGVTVAA